MNQYNEDLYECTNCGNVWDGDAQCLCGMVDYEDESSNPEVSTDDTDSVSSDASDMLAEMLESGHIDDETTRKYIQQMLIIARSQEITQEVPEWMDETRDYLTNGVFIDGMYHVSAYPVSSEVACLSFKKMAVAMYPMLTDEECDRFSCDLDAGMSVDDIVDGLNIKRMRDYDTARVYQLHWPQWVNSERPTLELVKIRGTDDQVQPPPFNKIAMAACPMLTEDECHTFSMRLEAGMAADDIVKDLNAIRKREFDTDARRFVWKGGSYWGECDQPKLELIEIRQTEALRVADQRM